VTTSAHDYVVIGGGTAGAAAVQGIRSVDEAGSILLLGAEPHLPYDRPPLTKDLWFGKTTVEEIAVEPLAFYEAQRVECVLGRPAVTLDARAKRLTDAKGDEYRYGKLLLATGGEPRRLAIPGGDLDGISYYRRLDDYLAARATARAGRSAVVVGGGFIGSEIAAALTKAGVAVTMLFQGAYLVDRIFPESLGRALTSEYEGRGVRLLAGDEPTRIEAQGDGFVTTTKSGASLSSDMMIVGIGITPAVDLARAAGLDVGNGVVVDELLQTSAPDVFAAGDNALFPYQALGKRMRVEHWDNAVSQGRAAGRNMAGAHEPYTHMPFFFSDLFDFGYEAVGDIDARLDVHAEWERPNDTGILYYLEGKRVRGVMMCNVWEKVDVARELIRRGGETAEKELRDALH
jgi:NADPH-dependent 2,4-dienoyl-CoA reductase/sulfur reductase-like enzyme